MKEKGVASWRSGLFQLFLFQFLLLIYPLLSFIWRRSYSPFSLEVASLFFLSILTSILLLFLTGNRHPVIRSVFLMPLI